jgi:DNA-directed RNA polymerase specialized sigma24 family protein
MSDADGSITQAFQQMRAGDTLAAGALFERFFPRLVGLARKTLAGRPQRVADANDAAQSAFASFCQRVGEGQFSDLLRRDDLWNLLGTITVRKSLQQARREGAAKRGGGAILGEDLLRNPAGQPTRLEDLAAQLPAQDFDLACEELLAALDDELRQFALLRLLGYRNREIAQQLDCTERKVERKLNLVRLKWEGQVE